MSVVICPRFYQEVNTKMYRSDRHPKRGKSSVRKEMTPSSGRVRVGGIFRIQGQGYQKQDQEHAADGAAAASGILMASNALPADSESENDGDTNPMLVDELVGINKTLEKQIETLRLRLDFDTRHHEAQKSAIIAETGAKLKSKAEEVNILKQQISAKDVTIKEVTCENEKRDGEISYLRRQIEALNSEVDSAKTYANDLVSELTNLTREKERLEMEGVFGEKDKEVDALRKEVSELKLNLTMLESELTKAREVITTQNGKIKLMDSDKKSLQLKFKEELAKVSHSMRLEVEKMRDVMKKQWEEMRALREQNMSMSRDIKDIRSLLVNGCLDDDAKVQQQQDGKGHVIPQEPVAPPIPVPQTARGGKTVYNNFNMGALKPSLPVLNKDKKSNQRRK
ncbi:probable E3 ubiquitin-protein ligase bre1 isoform X2 [Mercenaria mercenaria]|uniref:probable E3 ubiquitin-protein ligase bre1 isoform X2 n=1 Tax=Mercenaria mercenaria TaxID=6596 RepID=UPI00234E6D41|nr:probable E3 ubiquitin-protein ligase bre1 isoform X2 [Mercenaria mercenaria]